MNFLDRSGHIFNLPSYSYEPIGHEFEENDYVFWIDNSKMNKLSINNYYIKTIYLVVPFDRIPIYNVENEYDLTPEQKEEIIRNHPMIKHDTDDINTYTKYIDNIVAHDIYKFSDVARITISSQSNKFCLIRPTDIQDLTSGAKNITDYINYDLTIENKLVYINSDNDDLCAVIVSSEDEMQAVIGDDDKIESLRKHNWTKENLAIVPIYVLCMSIDEGTWLTNLLIHVENKISNIDENGTPEYYDAVDEDWCSITIGAEFNEENEILYINGKNMGIDLPKDMFRAIYQNSFINNEFNEQLYNEKLKEYLINYMQIKGECGNYSSVINSLKWFGYGDKMTVSKLLRTDNEFKYQYLKDYFNITTDVLKSFNHFKNSTYISLTLNENSETGNYNEYNINKNVYGEGTPELEDNFKKLVEVEYDYNNEKFKYIKPYYDFTFNEMGLKIACLKYYYKKYFLPLHLKIHSASIAHKVYTNDIKFNNEVYKTILSEHPILLGNMNKNRKVLFEKSQVKYFIQSQRYVDNKFNEFYSYDQDKEDVYEINDTCLSIPIRFVNDYDLVDPYPECKCNKKIKKEKPTYFSCVLLLEKEFYIKDTYLPYRMEFNVPVQLFKDTFALYNKDTKRKEDFEEYQFAYSTSEGDTKQWSQWINGINGLKQYILNTATHEIYAKDYETDPSYSEEENDKLRKEDDEVQIEILHEMIEDSANIYQISYAINCDNIKIDGKTLTEILDGNVALEKLKRIVSVYHNGVVSETNEQEYNGIRLKDYAQELNTENYYVRIPSINDLRKNPINIYDISADIVYVPKIYIKMKYDKTEIYDFKLNGISYKNNVQINFVKETSLIYESHFNFVQNPDDPTTVYHSFILYPRMMNNKDINFFVNQEFKLKLLVNDQWYEYKFIAKMTDIDIQFGKLVYKYWSNNNKFISRFRQLSDDTILDNQNPSNSVIKFNSYMHEPNLVTVNDVNYLQHLENYVIKYNIISTDDIMRHRNCQYINYKGLKIFFNQQKLVNNHKENNLDFNITELFSVAPEEVSQTYDKDPLDPTMFVLNRLVNFGKKQIFNYKHGWNDTPTLIWESLYKNTQTIWEDYKKVPQTIDDCIDILNEFGAFVEDGVPLEFYYDEERNEFTDNRYRYLHIFTTKFYYDEENNVLYSKDVNGVKTIYDIHEYNDYLTNFKLSSDKYFNNFIMSTNLPHNRKYLNNLQLYDIYEKELNVENIFTWTKYTNLCCNGVLFYHSNTNNAIKGITIKYNKANIDKTLTLNNSIRISGTPLWDDDVYSNDIDLYSNYTNYDITTYDEHIYELDGDIKRYSMDKNGKLKLTDPKLYNEKTKYPFHSARKISIIDKELIVNNYTYFYYEDFTGKRYYTVESLNDKIYQINAFNNSQNNTKYIQISNLFGIYSMCPQNQQNILLTPRPEQYNENIAINFDPLYKFETFENLDKKLDSFNNTFNYSKLTHVCDIYVDSLYELSSENMGDISFDGENVKWDYDNAFTKESTTIKRFILNNDNAKYAYFIMTDYKRFIYRPNDVRENIDIDVAKLFSNKPIGNQAGLLLYYKLSYAKMIKDGENVKYVDISSDEIETELTTQQIHEIAIGHACDNIKICVQLYYNMTPDTFISTRFGEQILVPMYIDNGTINTEYNNELIGGDNDIFKNYELSWKEIRKNYYRLYPNLVDSYSKYYDNLDDYFKMFNIIDNKVKLDEYDPDNNFKFVESTYNILLSNVLDTIYINEHNNELIPTQQPSQYIYSITQENISDQSLKNVLESLNNNSKVNEYEKMILDLDWDSKFSDAIKDFYQGTLLSRESLLDDYNKRLKSFNNDTYPRESLRSDYENTGERLTRLDDYVYDKYENVYVIKTISNTEGKILLDFELFFNESYYSELSNVKINDKLVDNSLDVLKSDSDTYFADFVDVYHKDSSGKDKVWYYEYYTPKYLKDNVSVICVIRRNGDPENVEVLEIKYNNFDINDNIVHLNKKDVLYIYFKIKLKRTENDEERHLDKHGVYNRVRIPEFYIIPLAYHYIENMVKLKYESPSKQYDNLYEALLYNQDMTSTKYFEFEKLFAAQNNKLYTEFFEEKYVIRNEDNSIYELKHVEEHENQNVEVITKETFDIERLYDLEKQYLIWSKTHSLKQTNEQDADHSILVTDGEHKEIYFDINTLPNSNVSNIDNLSTIDKTNLINFAKYQYAILMDSDFYSCKAYFNNEEIVTNDYVYNKKYTKFISPKVNINMFLDYDMYLMHDNNYWYAIFISQQTIHKVDNESKLNVLEEQKTLLSYNSASFNNEEREIISANGNKIENDYYHNYTPYELRYVKSNNDFLINRMKFISSEGVNIFNNDDIIVGNITNNNRLPINMIHSSKWNIKPLSYGINFTKEFNSNTEMCILSYPDRQNTIERGYYDVSVRYSLDRNVSHQYNKKAKFKIK